MKKHMMMALALALLPTLAMAAPDFSGTWARDASKSDPVNYPVYWLTRTAPIGGGADAVVEIKQDAGSLQIANPARRFLNYALDGKAHAVAMETGLAKANLTATLQDDALTIATVQPYGGMPGNVMAKVKETWRLSANGKVLTITTIRDTPAKQQTSKEVFVRR